MIYRAIGDDWGRTSSGPSRRTIGSPSETRSGWCDRTTRPTRFVWDRIVTEADAPATPSGIVLAVHGYYGYRAASIWKWLAAKRRVDNGS